AKGLQAGECPDLWTLTHPEQVRSIAESYIAAGSDIVETNSFGGSTINLQHYGLEGRTAELNEMAAQLSRKAAGNDKFVVGSVGPTGKMLTMGDVSEDEMYQAFKTQVIALERGGVDAVCIETMTDLDEAQIAIRAAKENTNLEIICTFTFDAAGDNQFFTMMGVSPSQAAIAAVNAGADIIGSNCGNGINNMVEITGQMRAAAPNTPIMIQANAGLPISENGKLVFPETPEDMAALIPDLIQAGANIVGGCCGTTPAHIKAIKNVISNL
ncbi:MAG: homocysteine S-methyltransferase family protein, partial [Paludibacter sp.]|nr:homocysteine S-methyltransferase family protein [Paludibacter sp.]